MMPECSTLTAPKKNSLAALCASAPIQKPIIVEVNLIDIGPAMRHIESVIQQLEPDRVRSRFQLWSPLFNNDAALESVERYEQLISLMHSATELMHWLPPPLCDSSEPILFTALPLSLTQDLVSRMSFKPILLTSTAWSIPQLPMLARASILDGLTGNH
jgi:hypothetical protein